MGKVKALTVYRCFQLLPFIDIRSDLGSGVKETSETDQFQRENPRGNGATLHGRRNAHPVHGLNSPPIMEPTPSVILPTLALDLSSAGCRVCAAMIDRNEACSVP